MGTRAKNFFVYGIFFPLFWISIYYFIQNIHTNLFWIGTIGLVCSIIPLALYLWETKKKA